MPEIRGTLLSAPVTTGNSDAKFGTHYSSLGIGGYQEFQTIAERDAIPVDEIYGRVNDDGRSSGRRRFNMLVFVWETNRFYQLFIPGWDTLVADEQKYNALLNNGYWRDPPFYIPPQYVSTILKLPANYLWTNPGHTGETFFFDPEYDFNGRFTDNMFLLDTAGLTTGIDANAHGNVTSNVFIKIVDSALGGYIGEGYIAKRVNGVLTLLAPGDIMADRLYLLIPPPDRTMNGAAFAHPFELVKWDWAVPATPPATNALLRISPANLYGAGGGDSLSEILLEFDNFDFNGRSGDTIFLLDTAGLETNVDANAHANISNEVRIKIEDSALGGTIGRGHINKRVDGELVALEPGDLKAGQLYFLIPPADRSVPDGMEFTHPFELVKWEWNTAVSDKNYVADIPVTDTGNTQYVYGYIHKLGKMPSVTILDGANKIINGQVDISIDPATFDVVMAFAYLPVSGKVILN